MLFFLSLQGSILRSDPYSLGETLGPEPRFLELASRRSDRIPGAIHWRLQQCRDSSKMVFRAFQSPKPLASRQFLLFRLQAQVRRRSIITGTLEITVIFAIVYALAWNFRVLSCRALVEDLVWEAAFTVDSRSWVSTVRRTAIWPFVAVRAVIFLLGPMFLMRHTRVARRLQMVCSSRDERQSCFHASSGATRAYCWRQMLP